jgi:prepilin-type N-terminal cleavage/methylation domain-containing protein/prepilin-type processing-associated H-X9-DG protein
MKRIQRFTHGFSSWGTSRRGFTLIELLVVIAIISILAALLMPALKNAQARARQVGCAARMKSWGSSIYMYSSDHGGRFPPYAVGVWPYAPESSVWINTLAAYVGGILISPNQHPAAQQAQSAQNHKLAVRECPTGEAFVGAHYNRPFAWVLTDSDEPINLYEINKPSGWIAFMDTYDGWGMYSPAGWRFNADLDGDGIKDSNLGTYAAETVIYNYAKPRVHLEGMNVTMIDGHVEWVSFQDFLNPDHPNWTDIP